MLHNIHISFDWPTSEIQQPAAWSTLLYTASPNPHLMSSRWLPPLDTFRPIPFLNHIRQIMLTKSTKHADTVQDKTHTHTHHFPLQRDVDDTHRNGFSLCEGPLVPGGWGLSSRGSRGPPYSSVSNSQTA